MMTSLIATVGSVAGLRAQVAMALSHKGAALALLNRPAEEVAAFQQFDGAFATP